MENAKKSLSVDELKEYASVIRTMIQHENILINHRLGWMLAFQGFLLGTLTLVFKNADFHQVLQYSVFSIMIIFLGILSCVSVGYSLHFAAIAIERLENKWNNFSSQEILDNIPPIIGFCNRNETQNWLFPWYFLPSVMGLLWFFLLFFVIIKIL